MRALAPRSSPAQPCRLRKAWSRSLSESAALAFREPSRSQRHGHGDPGVWPHLAGPPRQRAIRTSCRRRTFSRPTTSKPRSTSDRTSPYKPTLAVSHRRRQPRLGSRRAASSFGLGVAASPARQDVGTKITITPHLNESDEVRLELAEEISEAGDRSVGVASQNAPQIPSSRSKTNRPSSSEV
jgi:hypothetical protein